MRFTIRVALFIALMPLLPYCGDHSQKDIAALMDEIGREMMRTRK